MMRNYMLPLLVGAAFLAVPAQAQTNWESDYGTAVLSGDDGTAGVNLGFLFPFLGNGYNGATISTNGFVEFGGSNGNGCCNGDVGGLLGGAARIAPQWFDLVDTVYLNTSQAGRAVITWQGYEYSGNGALFTTQAQLFADGHFLFGYQGPGVSVSHNTLVGYSAGNGASNPGASDFSFASNGGASAYQLFGPNSFDLNGRNVTFTPNGNGGYAINAVAGVPEPAAWGMMIGGFGLAGAAMRRRRAATKVSFA
jgi:hypothetical protein